MEQLASHAAAKSVGRLQIKESAHDGRGLGMQLPHGGHIEIELPLMDGSDTPGLELDDENRAVRLLHHTVDRAPDDGTAAVQGRGERQLEYSRCARQRGRDVVATAGAHPHGCRPAQQALLIVENDSLLGAKQTTTLLYRAGQLRMRIPMLEKAVDEDAEQALRRRSCGGDINCIHLCDTIGRRQPRPLIGDERRAEIIRWADAACAEACGKCRCFR